MKPIKSLIKRLKKSKINLLQILVLLYLYLIPIWPKLPLLNINYTYIAIRYEDLFVALLVGTFLLAILFRKTKIPKNPFTKLIPLYWLVVIASALIGFYHFKSITTLQLGLLHALRRVEYMIVFFVALSTVTNIKQLRFYLNHLMVMLTLVSIYGIGQKFLGWPAVQTMNPHYSKGYLLTLDANARISSTFGGHYDFAAFLVFMMPLALGCFLTMKKNRYFVVFVLALVSLILTASRASYIAYWLTVPLFLLLFIRFKFLVLVVALTLVLTPLSNNLTKRINRTFRQDLVWIRKDTGQAIVPRKITADDLPAGDYVIQRGSGTEVKEQTEEQVKLVKAEIRKKILEDAHKAGKEINKSELERKVEETFTNFVPVNSVLPDISFATRLQVEWPRAINAFFKNPLTGTGVASITEATDNDYLRALGETGLLGFGLFMLILFKLHWFLWQKGRQSAAWRPLLWGLLFGGFALLINALYIDVFEASKVALMIWLIWGMFYRIQFLKQNEIQQI
jgi:hypothetical protein